MPAPTANGSRPNPFDFDTIIRNGIVVTASDESRCEIGIKG